jgi:hypothetical protein
MMDSSVTVAFGVWTVCVYLCVCTQSEAVSSTTEADKSCVSNVTNKTDHVCELNQTDVTLSAEVITESVNGTAGIADVESTLSTEIVGLGNATQSEFSVNTTMVKPDIQTVNRPETTMEPLPATVETVVEAQPISSEICTCDLKVGI